jgi:D-threo-aldose 1-dehydrogenase
MRHITLKGTSIRTSALGFGCAGLMRLGNETERQRVLGTAFDHGVCHFDTARMYGLGRVEAILGKFIHSRRDQVTVTTKFGIQLNAQASLLSYVQSGIRRAMALSPRLLQLVRRRAARAYRAEAFGVEDARKSLEQSLRELKTDYVDLFLLHECSASSVQGEDLLGFLENLVRAGTIRGFGIATTFANTLAICDEAPAFARVVQFENDILRDHVGKLPDAGTRAVITHGGLSGALEAVHRVVSADPLVRVEWSESLGVDCSDRRMLAALLLRYCLEANPEGIVLFHSNSPEHIKENIQSQSVAFPTRESLSLFAEMIGAKMADGRQRVSQPS